MHGDLWVALVHPADIDQLDAVVGSYSHALVSRLPFMRRMGVAQLGIAMMSRYYKVDFSISEVLVLAQMICDPSQAAASQPTTGEGVEERPYRWLTKVVATHWKRLNRHSPELGKRYNVDTVVESCLFGNFSAVPSVLEYDKSP